MIARLKLCLAAALAALALATPPATAAELPSVEKFVDYFDLIVFRTEMKGVRNTFQIRKWPWPEIKYKLAGRAKEAARYKPVIEAHGRTLTRFSDIKFRQIPGKQRGEDMIIWFARQNEMFQVGQILEKDVAVLRQLIRGSCYFLSYHMPSGKMVKAMIVVNVEYPSEGIKHCLLEEMIQSMGLPNDSPYISPSIFNDNERRKNLSLIDKVLLRTLYDKRMTAGMDRREALKTPAGVKCTPPTTMPTNMRDTTMAVASFIRLSPSTNVVRRLGAPSCLKIAITATGSVALRIDPSIKLSAGPSGVKNINRPPMMAVDTISPGMARVRTGSRLRCSCRASRLYALSNTSVGRKTKRMTWGESSSASPTAARGK